MPSSDGITSTVQSINGQDLKSDMRRLSTDVAQLRDDLKIVAMDATDAARHRIASAREGVSRTLGAAKDKGIEASDAIKNQIATRPFTTIGIAVGVGLIAGFFLLRSRR